MLVEHGFAYDSSAMGDDRPYVEEHDGLRLLELPVHWSLDDWPRFGWSIDLGGNVGAVSELHDSWLAEYESARADRRHVCFTMHPEVIGRAYRFAQLERLRRSHRGGRRHVDRAAGGRRRARRLGARRTGGVMLDVVTLDPAPPEARGRQLGRERAEEIRATLALYERALRDGGRRAGRPPRRRPRGARGDRRLGARPRARDRGHRRRRRPAGRARRRAQRAHRGARAGGGERRAASAASPSSWTPSRRARSRCRPGTGTRSSPRASTCSASSTRTVTSSARSRSTASSASSASRAAASGCCSTSCTTRATGRASACRSTSSRDGCWTRRSTSTTPCSCSRRRAPSASSALTLVAVEDGERAAITAEVFPGGPRYVLPDRDGVLLHTNHFVAPEAALGDRERVIGPDSYLRLGTLQRTVRGTSDAAAVRRAMSSRLGGGGAICCRPDPDAVFGERWSTLATIQLDVAERGARRSAAAGPTSPWPTPRPTPPSPPTPDHRRPPC